MGSKLMVKGYCGGPPIGH